MQDIVGVITIYQVLRYIHRAKGYEYKDTT